MGLSKEQSLLPGVLWGDLAIYSSPCSFDLVTRAVRRTVNK